MGTDKGQARNRKGIGTGEETLIACVHRGLSHSVVSDSLRSHGLSPPGSPVHGVLQAGTPEWVAMPFSRGSSRPRDRTCVSCTAGGLFTAEPGGEPSCPSVRPSPSFITRDGACRARSKHSRNTLIAHSDNSSYRRRC